MPPTKVCLQCKAAVSVRWRHVNAVIMSFNPNEKQSVICKRKLWNVWEACERASEIRTLRRQEQKRMRMASMRVSRDSDRLWSTHYHMHCCAKGLALQCLSCCFAIHTVRKYATFSWCKIVSSAFVLLLFSNPNPNPNPTHQQCIWIDITVKYEAR